MQTRSERTYSQQQRFYVACGEFLIKSLAQSTSVLGQVDGDVAIVGLNLSGYAIFD